MEEDRQQLSVLRVKLIIITPVRNEEEYIRSTVESVLAQTVLPYKWVIVDDGSTDETGKIVQSYVDDAPFLQYVSLGDRGYRKPGQGVVETFYAGFETIERLHYDVIAKMDGDLQFGRETFETIVKRFLDEPELGITGVVRYERSSSRGNFKEVLVPKGWVGGPFKFYRRKCFEDIGGLIPRAGWDGVDIVRARMKGWKTGEIASLKLLHLKPTGTAKGEGLSKACEKYGDISYYMGGYFWYFVLRTIGRSLANRNPKIGLYMVKGYCRSRRNGIQRESSQFRAALRKIQRDNMLFWLKRLIKPTDHV